MKRSRGEEEDGSVKDHDVEPIADGWPGTQIVHLHPASPGAVRVVDEALPAALANDIYSFTLGLGRSWGTYVTLREATGDGTVDDSLAQVDNAAPVAGRGDAQLHSLATAIVRSVWLNGEAASELLTPELHRVHGFALWAIMGELGDDCAYHLDYAELHRRRTSRLHTPLLASTVHVSDIDAARLGDMEGGLFGVNTGGLKHYLRFGHHCNLVKPGELERDFSADPDWVKVGYRFRRAILFDGLLPHCATPIEAMAEVRLAQFQPLARWCRPRWVRAGACGQSPELVGSLVHFRPKLHHSIGAGQAPRGGGDQCLRHEHWRAGGSGTNPQRGVPPGAWPCDLVMT